jgi:hypothetical protein
MAQMDFENRNAQHRNSIGQGHRGMGPTPGIQEDKVWQVQIRSRRKDGYPFLNFFDKFAFRDWFENNPSGPKGRPDESVPGFGPWFGSRRCPAHVPPKG